MKNLKYVVAIGILAPVFAFADTTSRADLIAQLTAELQMLIAELNQIINAQVIAQMNAPTQVIDNPTGSATENPVVQLQHTLANTMQNITLVQGCVAGQPFYNFQSDGVYYASKINATYSLPDVNNGDPVAYNRIDNNSGLAPTDQINNPPSLPPLPIGTSVDYTFTAYAGIPTGPVVGTLSGTVVIASCQ